MTLSIISVTMAESANATSQTGDGAKPTQTTPGTGLTTLAFGVMSFILMLIIVMVVLVTAVNFRGRCHNSKEEGIKNYGSVVSEGNLSNKTERGSIMLVSMRTINTDTDTDSVRFSSIYSAALEDEDQ
ncbi:hypothetical protein HF521_005619 [Silurus meridionalis]|uniref:Endothelial cell-specific chemotaxis regulator n=1 Tax=Silurus meridionalis TaxID=175797 RepID=A0A8T0AWX4_SILME|nr:hypothetical protein HF521_005619 [Silurus meridionalis]